ncbi:lipopolysaccharide biosynthesis protein RfbH [Micromonospora rifamycinica]|uniref:CDP-6-deoxy-D-xylo-4-hexulose-3-dehydrase n=1 Tax=Micromonospora rifamycinica TaxID=291594 RepID=A0A109IKX3_9ACTN|nr:lipopolysaccharide biosynthesis protein RfbH [Micromonospora rifamycinica]KWV32454.1 lipopolysaccharide biosynthesis protein RfbH [Micromonospora rifamycinica]SCG35570.1 CDP-6-deoxy-D-xylo-4-hexulose-3-dehydrase [Micromonospora rifamycinica]
MVDPARSHLLELVRDYHDAQTPDAAPFIPGQTPILSSGAVLDADDREALVAAALDMRIASGQITAKFESSLARTLKRRKAVLTNSGSSANLLALSTLTSPELGDQRLKPGDEVITVAAGFPTTVNPILQNGLVPVFVDIELGTYNTTAELVEQAISPRTRAIMIAHTLGNPFPVAEIAEIAARHGCHLVEDNCDAVGSTYQGRLTGTFGAFSTISFYPAHHLTMGEGGMLLSSDIKLAKLAKSFRDWGRDCWCEPGEDDRCLKRFDLQAGTLPEGYDHKYVFSEVGYNLKSTDIQAALGLSQLAKLPGFIEARKRNWRQLREGLDGLPGLLLPEATPGSDPSWFGFIITVLPDAGFDVPQIVGHLERHNIRTRRLFAGNLTRHPAYIGRPQRIVGSLANSDTVTERTFWIGVYPGITTEMIEYVIGTLKEFVATH